MVRALSRALIAVTVYGAATACAFSQQNNSASPYPVKPVRMVVPLAPGGGSDIVGRIVALSLADVWKHAVVVDNRPGAGGTIGNNIVAKSLANGHTLLVSSSTLAIGPALYKNASSDVQHDFAAVSLLADQPSIMAAHVNLPSKSMADLIALFKSQPGKYAFGSAGVGTASHLANELFKTSAGVDVVHVPYKSAGLATTGLLSGEVQFMVTNMATALPQVRSGRLKGLAVTSAKRVAAVPDLPTLNEAGLPGFEYTTWYGMLAPAGTPPAIIARIHGDLAALAREPKIQERFSAQGLDVRFTTPAEFDAYLKTEIAKWNRVVKAAGLQAN